MKKLALVSANFGGIDPIFQLPEHEGIDCFYYTDTDAANHENAQTWTKVIKTNYPRYDLSPRVKAKYFKCQIHRLDEIQEYDYFFWTDSCQIHHQLKYLLGMADELEKQQDNHRMLVVPHPFNYPICNNTIQAEYEAIMEQMKTNPYLQVRYEKEMLTEQVEYYRSLGWETDKIELYASTCFMVKNNVRYHQAFDYWWDQNLKWGITDQLSLPIALAKYNIQPTKLNVLLWKNQFFTHGSHVKLM